MMSQLAVVPSPVYALCYERISDDKTGQAAGVTRQHAENEKVAEGIGATDIRHYREPGSRSASKDGVERPARDRLVADIGSGEYDGATVIAWAQDRLARKGLEWEQMLALFELHSIRFIAPADGIDMVPADGALISRIRNAVAVEEIRKLKARHSLAMAQLRAAGVRTGRAPFGWNADGTPHAEHAPMVREATDRVLAGEPLLGIAADWNARGLPKLTHSRRTVDGVKLPREQWVQVVTDWGYRNIGEIIARPSNAGWYMHKGVRLDVVPQWEALVPEDRYLALMNLMNGRKRPDSYRSHFLGGLIKCGAPDCTGTAHGVINRTKRGARVFEYPMYRCNKCQQRVRGIDEVDAYIQTAVVARLRAIRLPDLANASQRAAMSTASDEADALRTKLAAYKDAALIMDPADYAAATGTLRAALTEAEAEIQRLSDSRKHALAGLTGSRPARAWDSCTDDQKRAVISLLATITLLPGATAVPIEDRLSITWHTIA